MKKLCVSSLSERFNTTRSLTFLVLAGRGVRRGVQGNGVPGLLPLHPPLILLSRTKRDPHPGQLKETTD